MSRLWASRKPPRPSLIAAASSKRRANMIANGAPQADAEFLLKGRVELNAIPSDVLVKWIEAKLKKHGVKKVVPGDDLLSQALAAHP